MVLHHIHGIKDRIVASLAWGYTHKKLTVIGTIVVIGVAAAWWIMNRQHTSKITEASNMLYRAQKTSEENWDAISSEFEKSGQVTKAFYEIVEKYDLLITRYPTMFQAHIAALDLGQFYSDLKMWKEAKSVLERVSPDSVLRPLHALRMAVVLEALSDIPGAQNAWQLVVSDSTHGTPYHGIAKVQLARMAYTQNKILDAQKWVSEVQQSYSGRFEAEQAEKLRLYFEK